VVHGLEVEYFDKIDFVYLDIDDSRTDEFKRLLGYRLQPHIFLLDGEGNIIQQWLGIVPASDLRSVFDTIS
jgi:thioredoxin-related protein